MSGAAQDLQSQVEGAVARFGRSHPKVLPLRLRWARELFAQGRGDDAVTQLDALVADCQADLGPRHETTLVLVNNRAMALAEQGRPQGLPQLRALLPVADEVWGPRDRRTLLLRGNVAAATGMAGQFAEAAAQIEALLAEGHALEEDDLAALRTNLASWRQRAAS